VYNKFLYLKKSSLPGAGKGLFTRIDIPKGENVIEYKGRIEKWKDVKDEDGYNPYLFKISNNVVINAQNYKKSLGRYANDARGLVKIKGLRNNCEYTVTKDRCFITSIRKIYKGEEILVPYGKKFWDLIKKINRAKFKKR
jgi:uncharacterized protein